MNILLFRTTVLTLLSVMFFTACQVREEIPSLTQTSANVSPAAQFVPHSVPELFARFENAAENEVIAFDLPNGTGHPWRVEAWRDDFLADGFVAGSASKAESPEFSASDFITLQGVIVGQETGQVSLVLTRELIGGSIALAEETYYVSPPENDPVLRSVDGFMLVAASAETAPTVPGLCSVTQADSNAEPMPLGDLPANARTSASCSKIQLRVNADYEYYAYRAGSNVNLASFYLIVTMHEASKKLASVGNVIEVQAVIVFTSRSNPFYYPTSYNINDLWSQTVVWHNDFLPNGSWDGVVLFSGKNLAPQTTIGLAWMGAMCRYDGDLSYAVVQWVPHTTLGINLAAHEIGHLLGAGHTNSYPSDCQSNSLMQAGIPISTNAQFTRCSREQINYTRWFYHSCMSPGTCSQ